MDLRKNLIGQYKGYAYIENIEQASLEKKQEAFYNLTNLRI